MHASFISQNPVVPASTRNLNGSNREKTLKVRPAKARQYLAWPGNESSHKHVDVDARLG